ncbi:hypothetical protein OS493_020728 [Desmophyllum pertusum]|uniref:Major facilitator superfamily (MFS) profile domain-containing protein n=1 Tax=Desmophyllum pertusum TaxID=174260 RepID=A0A9X0CM22_9CNID|nr:hypothetical protein OS493_020728 [Desmophyllum pertusum]
MFGICLLLLPLARSYNAMVAFSVLFGVMDGGRYGLMPLVVIECVGQKRTDTAWGYLVFSVGFASGIGPTFIGFIADSAGAYGPAFFTAGGIMVFGSSLVFLKNFIEKKDLDEEKLEVRQHSLEIPVCERETVL